MSVGPLVASGIGILLLVATAYILVGGTLATTEVMVEAQNNLAVHQETRMRTAIAIQNTTIAGQTLYVEVKNTGSEPIVEISSLDVYLLSGGVPVYVPYGNWSRVSITPDDIHPGGLDPGETLTLAVGFKDENATWVQVVTGNGVSSSAYT
ncbi:MULTISPECIES: flagellar protein FlaF [unclassified Methanoculleus]|uniref:flagellar protein FlaF n=1 Tax=unclassified Methanoculleus TaxID=2619537 RepID=UPI0025EA921B|nr:MULTISPECIES: flagellar protein FlaF [unclassified Methanoculleus]MCK9319526.1 flagellar protein FlaF [Methanoculleus sp.]MDD2255296.1 flagellar protein FlaF [Methanoculleus sp.]MDD2788432.1 flagellar protein FlaF [Methanoculleus sp.]MDD3217452.1 flagellar protein FlaF [Methanoculleus sp.]MDD4315307.1 flagellar protein FlaF [Methanoculleus sp.]